jgi:propanol-preferring alcohol dehydrogenase
MVPGSNVVVIGTGGLGHMGVQIIKAMTAADVVAIDVKPEAMQIARECGADVVIDGSTEDVPGQVKEATGGGAEVVIDFVGSDATLATAVGSCKYQSDLTLVGVAGGSFPFNLYAPPYETAMRSIYWGTRSELGEVLALAAKGLITPIYKTYPLDRALDAYAEMESGTLVGRAVITP